MSPCVDSELGSVEVASSDALRGCLQQLEARFPQIERAQWEDLALILAGWDRSQSRARARTSPESILRYVALLARVCRPKAPPVSEPQHSEEG
jgi:hypothetical protein